MTILLACQDHLPPGETFRERLANLKRYGFDAVELRGAGLLDRLPETRVALTAVEMPVSSICAGFEGSLVHPEPTQRQTALDGIKRLLDVAEEFGAHGLIMAADYGAPPLPDLRPAFDPAHLLRQLLLVGLHDLAEHLRGMRTSLFLEPLNRYQSRALRQMAPAVALCEEVHSPNIHVMYDTFHMAIEEADPITALKETGDRLGHVHLSDSNRQLPGRGHIDFQVVAQTLNGMGFGGAAALECDISGDPDILLRRSVEFLRSVLMS